MVERGVRKSIWIGAMVIALVGALAAIVLIRAHDLLPPASWLQAFGPPVVEPRALLFRESFLPRVAIGLIAGAGLGLAGTIFQQVLRNPLAEPATLGVSAGAQLALAVTLLWFPALYGTAQGWVALAGAAAAFSVVLWIAGSLGFSAVGMVVAGLMVSLICGSLCALLIVLSHDYLSVLFLWQSGALAQNGWASAKWLLAQILPLALLSGLLARPLEVLGLQDDGARSLGVSVRTTRIALLAVAVAICACVTSAVGVIGFVGLAAPNLTRALGARKLPQRLVWAPFLGACLLTLADQTAQGLAFIPLQIPTGALTGLLGAPLLIWLVFRTRPHAALPRAAAESPARLDEPATLRMMMRGSLVLVAVFVLALGLGRIPGGWHFASWSEFELLSPWRAPRAFAAMACGVMLSVAGALMQRMTGNPMASPELLGISSGATLAVILAMLLMPGFDPAWAFPAAGAGAAVTLVGLLGIAARSSFSPERLLLVGAALATLMTAVSSIALASGDPRTSLLIAWMSGSTYGVTATQAGLACATAVLVLLLAPLCVRWLDILPLGASSAQAVGVNIGNARLVLLLLTAAATAAATLIVGPLSFVGLMAPHMARMLGLQRPLPQLFGAAILGALVMVLADWLGRTMLSPWQLPAGMIATLIGAPYFLWLMRRRSR